MTHKELCILGAKWLKRHLENIRIPNCPLVLTELKTINSEITDIIGFNSRASVMIEVKAQRADFLRDFKKSFRKNIKTGVGEMRYYLCPEEMIKENEIPEKWGLLYVKEGKIRVVKIAEYQEANLFAEKNILLNYIRRKEL